MGTRNSHGTSGGGNIRQRPDERWEGHYTAGINPGTGKQIPKSIYGKTQKEARERLRKITSEIDEGSYLEPSKRRVGKWLDIWLNEYTKNVKPYTKYSYRVTIKNHLKPAFGYVRLAELNTVMVQAFLNNLVRSKAEDGKGLSPKTAINIHGVFHRALKQAVNNGLIRSNPTDACIRPRGERKPIRPLEDEEVSAFLRAIEGHRFASLYLVDLFTGMRQGEILGLT
ncbi:tyrosine-type recombinase/integrase [Agathobaculum sp. Marseille-P7918]|uniref:tyrosine-type recombinase/integrase n=1 Tax=Agathobaculum sp. Marseille-P7918 TaxID=2479843 RepID=UPI00356A10B9